MVQIIVTGHGNFASGMLSALAIIAGAKDHMHGVDFLETYSTEDLKQELSEQIEKLGEEVLIFTDLAGGSPYNVSVLLKSENTKQNIEVISGINFPMLLSAAFSADAEDASQLAELLIGEGKEGIFKFALAKPIQQEDAEDGI